MANTVNSPNMSLPVPVVGVDPGPQYAIDTNSCLALIDQHDHSAGNGVKVTPAGINISSDLPMTGNNLTLTRSVRFLSNASVINQATDLGCLYEVGVDLYYNDGSGNQIRLTQSGGVAGTSGSISGLTSPASASYSSGTFIFQSLANTSAVMDVGSVILRNNLANSKGLTLNPPSAMGSNYSLTLPSIPAQTNVMTLDVSGNMNSITYDAVGSNMTATGSNAISAVRTRTATVNTNPGIGGVAYSNNANFVTTSASQVAVLDALNNPIVATLTTSGRPVCVTMTINNPAFSTSGSVSSISCSNSAMTVFFLDGATQIGQVLVANTGGAAIQVCPGSLSMIVPLAAGTHTFNLKVTIGGGGTLTFISVPLVAYEL